MKKTISFLIIFVLMLGLFGCGKKPQVEEPKEDETPIVVKHTVQLYVEDELYKTLKIEDGKTIGEGVVEKPVLAGYEFVSWADSSKKEVDLATYKITAPTKLYATFKEVVTDDTLVVDQVKEEGKTYYLVVGWWETTALEADGVTPKVTSSLDVDSVRVFYANLKLYLKAYGATDEQIKNVQFRNYSSAAVADMGAAINADGDVDLVIGVGNNINSTAGVSLFEGNDGKQQAKMGTQQLSRYVALPNHEVMNNVAISVFDWIKTEVGKSSFTTQLSQSDMVVAPVRTNDVDVTVKVYNTDGTFVETKLATKTDEINVSEIILSEGEKFVGYKTTVDGSDAEIIKASGVKLEYSDIEALLKDAKEISLYPVVIKEVVSDASDLVVYIHVASSVKINEAEVELMKLRFEATLEEAKNINYVVVKDVDADGYKARIEEDLASGKTIDVVIGGNATTKNLTAIDEVYVNVSCHASHFADGSRKVIILSQADSTHLELAKKLYNFLVAEPSEYKLHVAFWTKNYAWVTQEEIESVKGLIETHLKTILGCDSDLLASHNVSITYYESTVTSVADLSSETKAYNDGQGVGLIVGTGGNATNADYMGSDIVEQKDCPTTIIAVQRKVAICEDSYLYRSLYDLVFTVVEATN